MPTQDGSKYSAERVEVFFDQALGQDIVFRNAWIPNFTARRIKGTWFLANPAGSWMFVDDYEYQGLSSVAIPISLYREAERLHLILTSSNGGSYFNTYRRWTTPHFRHPTHHIIVTTLRCNLSCSYCHAAIVPANSGKEYDLSLSTGEAILEFASNSRAPVQSFEFQGGESLLNKEVLLELVPKIRRAYELSGKEIHLSIQTNAILLSAELVKFFRRYQVSVGTSLDGPEEVHSAQRIFPGGRSSYAAVVQKVDKYRLPTLPTITRNSLPHWREIIDAQLAAGTKVVAFHNVYPINSAKVNWADVGVTEDLYLEFYDMVADYLRGLWTEGYYPLERRLRLALKKLWLQKDTDFADFGNPCGMVHSQIVYHTNGDIYTCDEGRDFSEFNLGNVFTSSYDEIVFGVATRRLKGLSLPNDPECLQCAYRTVCSTCPVYDRAATGELRSKHAGTDKCKETMHIYDKLLSWLCEDPELLSKLAAYHGIK